MRFFPILFGHGEWRVDRRDPRPLRLDERRVRGDAARSTRTRPR